MRKQKQLCDAGSKFICSIRGRLTPALIEDAAEGLAELIRITGG